jgi:hypothetical protein
MEQLTMLLSTGARLLCPARVPEDSGDASEARRPNESEILKGMPEWFRVLEVNGMFGHVETYYFSINGPKFRSIKKLMKWRENLQFETYDPDTVEQSGAVTF